MGKSSKNKVKKISQFKIINPFVAGVDVSEKEMVVAYPVSEEEIAVQCFESYTRDLHELVEVLKEHKIVSVAMESTGVYWIPLFLLLQENGLEACLVNARHVKNVTGRKDDEGDAEWIQKLHRCGLLSPSFQPDGFTRELRTVVRTRDTFTKSCTDVLNRMQSALEQMNLKIQSVLSDIDGASGIRIIEAILSGERDPYKLASLRDCRVKAPEEDVVKSLEGRWTREHLFTLKVQYDAYKFNKQQIAECDVQIALLLNEHLKKKNNGVMPEPEPKQAKRKQNRKNPVKYNITGLLNSINGVNVTEITGISEKGALAIFAEVGNDMTRWKSEKHFTSWLGLAPNTKVSGGKIISSKIPKRKQYAGQSFRIATLSIANSKSPLGDYYRRLRSKAGKGKAIVATARKLAVIYYRMITTKQAFNPDELTAYQKKYNDRRIRQLEALLEKLKTA
jgi:transposase